MSLSMSVTSGGFDRGLLDAVRSASEASRAIKQALGDVGAGGAGADMTRAAAEAAELARQVGAAGEAARAHKEAREALELATGFGAAAAAAKEAAAAAGGFIRDTGAGLNGLVRTLTGIDLAGAFRPLGDITAAFGRMTFATAKAAFYLTDLKLTSLASFTAMYKGLDAFFVHLRGAGALQSVAGALRGFAGQTQGLAAAPTAAAAQPPPAHETKAIAAVTAPALAPWQALAGAIAQVDKAALALAETLQGIARQAGASAAAEVLPVVTLVKDLKAARDAAAAPIDVEIHRHVRQARELAPPELVQHVRQVRQAAFVPAAATAGVPGAGELRAVREVGGQVREVNKAVSGLGSVAAAAQPYLDSAFVGLKAGAFSAAGAVAAVAGAVGGMVTAAVAAGRAVADFAAGALLASENNLRFARSLGITAQEVERFQAAARLSGVGADMAAGGMNDFAQHMRQLRGELRQGGGEMTQWLARMNLDPMRVAAADLDDSFRMISGALRTIPSDFDRAEAAAQVMGHGTVAAFQEAIAAGRGLENAVGGAGTFGDVLGADQTRQIHEAMQEAREAGGMIMSVMKGFANQAALALAPLIKDVGALLKDLAGSGVFKDLQEGFGSWVRFGADLMRDLIGWLREGRPVLEGIWEVVKAGGAAWMEIGGAVWDVIRAVGNVIGAFLGAAGSTRDWGDAFRTVAGGVRAAGRAVADVMRWMAGLGIEAIISLVEAWRTARDFFTGFVAGVAAGWQYLKGEITFDDLKSGRFMQELQEDLRRANAGTDGLINRLREVQMTLRATGAGSVFSNIFGGILGSAQSGLAGLQGMIDQASQNRSLHAPVRLAAGMDVGSAEAVSTVNLALAGGRESAEERTANELEQLRETVNAMQGLLERWFGRASGGRGPSVTIPPA